MSVSTTALPTEGTPKSVTSLVGAKLISSARAYKHGTVTVVEITFSDASTGYIKFSSNRGLEIGGATPELGSGTAVSW